EGMAAGALRCERESGRLVAMALLPFGALGLSGFGIDLYFAATALAAGSEPLTIGGFLSSAGGLRVLFDLVMLGMFGGFYIVPLQALIQARTAVHKRARVIACNNIFNSLSM